MKGTLCLWCLYKSTCLGITMGLLGYSDSDRLRKVWQILHAQLYGLYLEIYDESYHNNFCVQIDRADKPPLRDNDISIQRVVLFEGVVDKQKYITDKNNKFYIESYSLLIRSPLYCDNLIKLVTQVENERNKKNIYYCHHNRLHFLSNKPQDEDFDMSEYLQEYSGF